MNKPQTEDNERPVTISLFEDSFPEIAAEFPVERNPAIYPDSHAEHGLEQIRPFPIETLPIKDESLPKKVFPKHEIDPPRLIAATAEIDDPATQFF